MNTSRHVAIIDFGSQTTMLIARRIRELKVLAKVYPSNISTEELSRINPYAIILSGGPQSIGDKDSLTIDENIFSLGVPILGICYGMQLIANHFGATVSKASKPEFGISQVSIDSDCALFNGINKSIRAWMSHRDDVTLTKNNFLCIASTNACTNAAITIKESKIYGVQFHPEVSHCEQGLDIIKNFIFNISACPQNFDLNDYLLEAIENIKATVKNKKVIMGLSGGVDSSVAAFLIDKAIGSNLFCVYVNHGLHREGELTEVKSLSKLLNAHLSIIDAEEQFFSALSGVDDPEEKRKKIGYTFVDVFDKEASAIGDIKFLAQGTLYPDIIESQTHNMGNKYAIKSHHNVGGLPEKMSFSLLEPLKDLFKDEVRKIGTLLGLDEALLYRQPFPGPGLAVRIPGEVTRDRVRLLRKADLIVREEIGKAGFKNNLWQWFAVLLPVRSVGVMGDARCYGESVVIRVVESKDAMTADWAKLPYEILENISSRITNEVTGISRVLYDITQKPPGTIEWE